MRWIVAALGLAACTPAVQELMLEYQVGEELMTACNVRGERCPEYLAFVREWNDSTSNMVTFEKSLAAHKRRVAAGGSV